MLDKNIMSKCREGLDSGAGHSLDLDQSMSIQEPDESLEEETGNGYTPEEEEDEENITEIRFVPSDKSLLNPLFQAMNHCQALYPDEMSPDEDEDELEGEEEGEYDEEEEEDGEENGNGNGHHGNGQDDNEENFADAD